MPKDQASKGGLPLKTIPWPKKPGKSGPKRNTTSVKAVKQYPTSDGV